MPWTPAQERLFHGVESGSIKKPGLSPQKAGELLQHSTTKRQGDSLRRSQEG